jgi:PAS domain S-box-containing protein
MMLLDIHQQNKNINRAVYGLLITVIVIFVLVIILLQSKHDESVLREKEANDYHLAISNHSLKILAAIDKTRLWFRDHGIAQYDNSMGLESGSDDIHLKGPFSERDQMRSLAIEIDKLAGEIRTIHKQFQGEEFNVLHQLLESAVIEFQKDINALSTENSYSAENIDDMVAALFSISHQLQRLHQQSYREMRLSLVEFQRQEQKQIVISIVILVVIGLLGIVTMLRLVSGTLTELAHVQSELQEKESRLREAQQVAHMGYIERLPATNEINWSEETYHICGFPRDYKPTSESTVALVHPDDAKRVARALNATIEHKQDYNLQYRIIRPDSSEVFIHAVGKITVDEAGKVSRLLSTIVDITEVKIAEAKLLRYQDHLEELVDERTKELESLHEEFVRKERLATLGQLTGTVSHELRNPLGAIKSALYIIDKLGDKENDRIQKAIIRADRNIDRCTLIIEDLLDFTRVTKLMKHGTMIDEWLESVIEEQRIHPGIQIETNFSLKDLELNIDPHRLRRAVINIVDNACQSMMDNNQLGEPAPNSRLTVKTIDRNNRIEIIVSDNGSGIPDKVMQKIFEPLFSTKSFGVGLGMPTVKQIMGQHDGDIEIDTEEGQGTSVTLWLPFNQ